MGKCDDTVLNVVVCTLTTRIYTQNQILVRSQTAACRHLTHAYTLQHFIGRKTSPLLHYLQENSHKSQIYRMKCCKVRKSDTLSSDRSADTGSIHNGNSLGCRLKFRLPVQKQESHFNRSCPVTYVRNISKGTCFKLSGFPTSFHLIRCFLCQSDRETAEFLHVKDIITKIFYAYFFAAGNYN